MTRFPVLLAAAALLALAGTAAAQTVAVKPQTTVTADVVTLGDVFVGLDADSAAIVVAQAPALGRQLVLDAPWLQDAARANKLQWRPMTRFDRAVIERAGQVVGPDQIAPALAAALARHGVGPGHEIQMDTRAAQLLVPAGARPRVEIGDLRYDERSERFSATASASAGGMSASTALSGQAARMTSVPLPARRIERGEVIQAKDLRWSRVRAASLQTDMIGTEAALVGKAARRALSAGEAVRQSDVQAPIAIEKGALVTMVIQTPNMTLTTQGKALDEGAIGETIRVANSRSKKVVEAQVVRADTVVVPLAVFSKP